MIRFDVGYYDDHEQLLLENTMLADGTVVADKFAGIVEKGLEIDLFELMGLGLFNEQFDGDGWRTRHDLTQRARNRLSLFEDYFSVENKTLIALRPANSMGPGTTEWMGVAASLAAMDEAFGTHDADWKKLPIGEDKDLDFQVAATGDSFLVVESKGTVVENVRLKDGLSNHKRSIKEKKATQRPHRSGDILVGTIAAIPQDAKLRAKIWLVDPPPPMLDNPFRFKLITRLEYYRDLLLAIGRPHILIALQNRLRALASVSSIRDLDGLPLINADGEIYSVPPSFIQGRSHSKDGTLVVVTTPVPDGLLLLGLDIEMISLVALQQFDAIIAWSSKRRGRRNVEFSLLLSREEIYQLKPDGMRSHEVGRDQWYQATCDVSVSASGVVFGVARRPEAVR